MLQSYSDDNGATWSMPLDFSVPTNDSSVFHLNRSPSVVHHSGSYLRVWTYSRMLTGRAIVSSEVVSQRWNPNSNFPIINITNGSSIAPGGPDYFLETSIATNGREILNVIWKNPDRSDIYLIRSTDYGRSWSNTSLIMPLLFELFTLEV